jgi:hypothetical protein
VSDAKFKASFVVMDEAHVVKDGRNGTSRSAMSIDAWVTILVTATPTLNPIEDYFGIILQIWRRAGFFNFTLPTEASWGYTVDHLEIADIELEQVKKGWLLPSSTRCRSTRRRSNSSPWRSNHTNADMITMNNETITRRIFWYMDGAGPPRRALLDWSIRTGIKWWLMHHSAMRKIKTDKSLNRLGGEDIYKAVQQMGHRPHPHDPRDRASGWYQHIPTGRDAAHGNPACPVPLPTGKGEAGSQVRHWRTEIVAQHRRHPGRPQRGGEGDKVCGCRRPPGDSEKQAEAGQEDQHDVPQASELDAIDHRAFFVLTQVEDPLSNRLGYSKLHQDTINNRLHAKLPVDKKALKAVMRGLLEVAGEGKLHGQDSPGLN